MDTRWIDILRLIGQDVELKRAAGTGGGEWAGPCPFCGGKDRFRVWPNPDQGNPRFWCRQCGASGDAIAYVMRRDGVGFGVACQKLQLQVTKLTPPSLCRTQEPGQVVSHTRSWQALTESAWQRAADDFTLQSWEQMWAGDTSGRDYMFSRGLTETTLAAFALGYNPRPYRAIWGSADVWLPSGVVLPWTLHGSLWAVNVRRLDGQQPKYIKAKGSANGLFVAGVVTPKTVVVMVEGEIDALSVWQATRGCPVVAVATGSSTGGFLYRWIAYLAQAQWVILAFDGDSAGEKAAQRWRRAFPDAIRLEPSGHDMNDMLRSGDDIQRWLRNAVSI